MYEAYRNPISFVAYKKRSQLYFTLCIPLVGLWRYTSNGSFAAYLAVSDILIALMHDLPLPYILSVHVSLSPSWAININNNYGKAVQCPVSTSNAVACMNKKYIETAQNYIYECHA